MAEGSMLGGGEINAFPLYYFAAKISLCTAIYRNHYLGVKRCFRGNTVITHKKWRRKHSLHLASGMPSKLPGKAISGGPNYKQLLPSGNFLLIWTLGSHLKTHSTANDRKYTNTIYVIIFSILIIIRILNIISGPQQTPQLLFHPLNLAPLIEIKICFVPAELASLTYQSVYK